MSQSRWHRVGHAWISASRRTLVDPWGKVVECGYNFSGSSLRHFEYLVDQVRKLGKLLEGDLEQFSLNVDIHSANRVEADEAGMQLGRCVESSWRVLSAPPKVLKSWAFTVTSVKSSARTCFIRVQS